MKKLFKITSLILAGLLFISLIFGAGVYAANQDWFDFTGDGQIEQSEANVNEILEILEEVAARGDMTAAELTTTKDKLTSTANELTSTKDKLTTSQARVKELEDMNPSGLAKRNGELHEENRQLKNDKAQLTTARDNAIVERDSLQVQLDDEIRVHGELKDEYDTTLNLLNEERQKNTDLSHDVTNLRDMYELANTAKEEGEDYIAHLEAELTRANNLVEEHADYTEGALEKAKTYK